MVKQVAIQVGAWAVFLFLAFWFCWWVFHMVKIFTYDLYMHYRYSGRGICTKCKKPLTRWAVSSPAVYGSTVIKQRCDTPGCGRKATPIGDRHTADWAGF